jgi:outer membrane protein assembly factor BamA
LPRYSSFPALLSIVLTCASSLFAGPYAQFEGRTVTAIRVNGLGYTPESRVLRQVISEVGKPFTEENLRKDRERLDRMAAFSSFEAVALEDGEGVAIEYSFQEISRIFPYPSIEITAESGWAVGGGVKFANPGGLPAHLSAYAQFGGTTNSEMTFDSQWLPKDPLSYQSRVMFRHRFNELDKFNENALDPRIRLGRYLTEDLRAGALVNYFTISSKEDGITSDPSNRDHIFSPGFFVDYDTRNSWFMPTSGWQNIFDLTRSFGDAQNWRADIDIRRYIPVADRHTLALFSLTTLQTGTVGVGREIPIYGDFHIGGTNSQRGWDIDARRGKNQMLNTLEYRYTIVKPRPISFWKISIRVGLQAAVFGDLSTAWDDDDQFSKNFIGGGGVGLRLLMPWINMIRLDFGWGQPGRSVIPHIGAYEKAYEQRKRVR